MNYAIYVILGAVAAISFVAVARRAIYVYRARKSERDLLDGVDRGPYRTVVVEGYSNRGLNEDERRYTRDEFTALLRMTREQAQRATFDSWKSQSESKKQQCKNCGHHRNHHGEYTIVCKRDGCNCRYFLRGDLS